MMTYDDLLSDFLGYVRFFLYLCGMENTNRSYGRMELAQAYFPALCPRAAWAKFRLLLMEYDELAPMATMSRRTLTPREAGQCFELLGVP